MAIFEKKKMTFPQAGQNVRKEVADYESAVKSKGRKVAEDIQQTSKKYMGK
jgi:predicted  nucleic acid-binding Zn ribbon protein